MEPKKSSWNKKRERWISTALVIILFIIATIAPCVVIYLFATIGQ